MTIKRMIKIQTFLLMAIVLSGCLFPKGELAKNQMPYEDQLLTVQQAIDDYREEKNGLVPIKTKDADISIFEKYIIDYDLLKEAGLLSEAPGNAFENGGIYQYVIIDPEETAEVKLINLRTSDAVQSVHVKLDLYRDKHLYPPFGIEVADGLYQVDYDKLGLKEAPYVESPFTNEQLPIIMNVHGELFIDYRKDLMQALKDFDHTYSEGDDIRYLLTDHYPFVPAHSLPYTIKNNEPVFMIVD